MKLEQLSIPLIPRTTVNCLDLGVQFYGRHLSSLLRLWMMFAVPTVALVYWGTTLWEWNLLYVALVLFLVTGPLGVLLAARTVRTAFGEPFDSYPANKSDRWQFVKLIFRVLLARIGTGLGMVLFFFPGWWIGVRASFQVEKTCLSDLQGRGEDRRNDKLIGEELGQLMQRSLGIGIFLSILVIVLFRLCDFTLETLFSKPILWGRLEETGFDLELRNQMLQNLLWGDPLVLAVIAAIVLLVYPIGRLAWFFSYIDLRVRGDFWDLELAFHKEVERLREGTA